MNYFLILIILALCVGGYFEYTTIQDFDSANKQKFADLNTKIDALQAANTKLEDDEKQLAKTVADLTKQVSGGPMQLNANSSPATPKGPPPPSNILGAISTVDGKTYQSCRLLKVEADGIVINHTAGILKLAYALLPPDLQKRFGYDMKQGLALSADQVQFDEQQRQAAGD